MMSPKLGRNDPCWCGSGQKYKRCHLRQDQEKESAERVAQRATQRATLNEPPAAPGLPAVPARPGLVTPADLMDDESENDQEWERFEQADANGKIAIFEAGLENKSLDDELAFEMLLSIRDATDPLHDPQARARFAEMVESLRRAMPELYQESRGYYLRDLIYDCVADQRWDALPPLLDELAPHATQNIDEFIQVVDLLMYHGQFLPLLAAVDAVWPQISKDQNVFDWVIDELASKFMTCAFFDYLLTVSAPRADDPQLVRRLNHYGEFDSEWFEMALHHLTTVTPWRREDFDGRVDADQWQDHVDKLLLEFIGDEHRRHGMPLSRGEMARDKLGDMLHWHFGAASLDAAPTSKRAKKSRPKQPISDTLLVPTPAAISKSFMQEFSMFSGKPHPAGVLIEFLPAYLHFLARLGLVGPDELDDALKLLKSPAIQGAQSLENYGADLRLSENVRAAWDAETLAALRQSIDWSVIPQSDQAEPVVVASPQTMRFQVTYLREPDIWLVIEMRGDQTLDDLHRAIIRAIDFDFDHLYAFFISGEAWDRTTEYSDGPDARSRPSIRLDQLPLRLKQRILYIYDFGDEHRFEVQLVEVGHDHPSGVYPQIIERHGKELSQYGEWGQEDWDEDDWDEDMEEDEL